MNTIVEDVWGVILMYLHPEDVAIFRLTSTTSRQLVHRVMPLLYMDEYFTVMLLLRNRPADSSGPISSAFEREVKRVVTEWTKSVQVSSYFYASSRESLHIALTEKLRNLKIPTRETTDDERTLMLEQEGDNWDTTVDAGCGQFAAVPGPDDLPHFAHGMQRLHRYVATFSSMTEDEAEGDQLPSGVANFTQHFLANHCVQRCEDSVSTSKTLRVPTGFVFPLKSFPVGKKDRLERHTGTCFKHRVLSHMTLTILIL